jgi:hypothetical protein
VLLHDRRAGVQTIRGAHAVDPSSNNVEPSSDNPEATALTALPGTPLRRNRDCQVEVQYLQDDLAALGAALATHPPQWLQAEVMAEIARTPQVPSALPGKGTGSFPPLRGVPFGLPAGPGRPRRDRVGAGTAVPTVRNHPAVPGRDRRSPRGSPRRSPRRAPRRSRVGRDQQPAPAPAPATAPVGAGVPSLRRGSCSPPQPGPRSGSWPTGRTSPGSAPSNRRRSPNPTPPTSRP